MMSALARARLRRACGHAWREHRPQAKGRRGTWAGARRVRDKRSIVSSVVKPWIWRRYNGINPHRHHMHISVVPEPHRYDDIRPWDLSALELKEDADATSPQTPDASSVPASAGR